MLGWWQTTASDFDARLLAVGLAALFVSGSLTLWIRFIWRATEGQPILPYEPRRPVPWTIPGLLIVVVIFFAALALFSLLYLEPFAAREYPGFRARPFRARDELITSAQLLVFMLAQLTALLAALLGFRLVYRAQPEDWGLVTSHVSRDVFAALVAALAFLPPIYAMQSLLHRFISDAPHPIIRSLMESDDTLLRPVAFIVAGIWAPICEELVFRVMLQGWLERVLIHRHQPPADEGQVQELAVVGDATPGEYAPATPAPRGGWLPIAISSALFAAVHVNFQSPNLDIIPLFFFACGLGYLYQRTHRAIPSILLHMMLNVCSLTALMLTLSSP